MLNFFTKDTTVVTLLYMFQKTITKEEINLMPQINFTGNIHLITDEDSSEKAITVLGQSKVLGFDTETRPAFNKGESYPICLLQLSTENDAYLFRLNTIPFHKNLRKLLEREDIIKTGVAIHDDIKGLKKLGNYKPGGFIEIADLAKQLGILKLGLQSLTAILLGKKLSKKNKLTNWEKKTLTPDQLKYAATDA